MTDDLNALPQPDDQEPVAPPEPQPPTIDVDAAYRIVAENEGWDPRLTRYEMQEIKRRKDDLERKEREFEQRTLPPPRQEPMPDFSGDPYGKMLYEVNQRTAKLESVLEARDRKERDREQKDQLIESLGSELGGSYNALARQSGLTKDQIKAQETDFFALLTDMYPEPEMISRLGPERAVRNAFLAFRNGNGNSAPPQRTYRDPRASYVVPAGPTGTTAGNGSGYDASPQRSGETIEQYGQRIAQAGRMMQEQLRNSGLNTLPKAFSSE